MQNERTPPAVMRIPPPILFLLVFLVGMAGQRLLPLPGLSDFASGALTRDVGWALVAIALVTAGSCATIFLRRWTTIIPQGRPSALVIVGPYRLSRNPMYLTLTTAYLGALLLTGDLWPLLLLPIPLYVLNFVVIPYEEGSLRAAFGTEYEAYCRSVRRWL